MVIYTIDNRELDRQVKINLYWAMCKTLEIPFLKLRRDKNVSEISWDLWCIDIAYLQLNKNTSLVLDKYVEALMSNESIV